MTELQSTLSAFPEDVTRCITGVILLFVVLTLLIAILRQKGGE